jgi:tetratricopeptide (TPR) repeat protein
MDKRDEYAYQTLASLYVEWAHGSSDPTEVTDYLAKAETVINEGLRQVRAREGLWLVSSRIQEILGNKPEYIRALQKAATAPSASIVAKYLLGRAYRRSGDPQNAVQILIPLVEANPEEFRACVELARAMSDLGEPYTKCIAVLKLSTLYGLSDPRFVGILGGMLFMNRDFTEAKEIFAESQRREFPAVEGTRIQFRPRDNATKSPLKLTGQVAAVKIGYAFIDARGFTSFFCPGSKLGRLVMRQGMTVEFEPVFTARGAMADKISVPAPAARLKEAQPSMDSSNSVG